MRDDVNWHEVEACVGSEFVYVVIALAAAVFHSLTRPALHSIAPVHTIETEAPRRVYCRRLGVKAVRGKEQNKRERERERDIRTDR